MILLANCLRTCGHGVSMCVRRAVSGAAILFTVLGFNLLGDGLRDVLDPKLRR